MVKVTIIDLNTGKQVAMRFINLPEPNMVAIFDFKLAFSTDKISIRVDPPLGKET